MISFVRDLRYSARQLFKNPVFTTAAILTLALGIGANTAIFSIVNGMLFRTLPVPAPERLVALGFSLKDRTSVVSYPDLQDIRQQADSVVDLFGYRVATDGLSAGGRADQVITSYVTGTYFSGLEVKPALGRLLLPSEGGVPGTDPVTVLSYTYWKTHFGGNPSIIGSVIRINGYPATVVGVAEPGFQGAATWMNIQAFLPLNMSDIDMKLPLLDRGKGRVLFVLGRLRPGVSLQAAKATLNVVADRLAQEHPQEDAGARIFLQPESEASISPVPQPGVHQRVLAIAILFLGLALLVLMMACLNLGNLVLVRSMARRHELAIRAALGASRWNLMRHSMAETFVLAACGCVGGVLIGLGCARFLQAIRIQMGVPVAFNFGLDARVLGYAIAAALFAAFFVGLVPALRASSADPNAALHEREHMSGGGRNRLRSTLVVGQISASLLLLIVAALFMRGLFAVEHMDLGFNPNHLLKMELDPHGAGLNPAQEQLFYTDVLQRVRGLPGVRSASLSFVYPSEAVAEYHATYVRGRTVPDGQLPPDSLWNPVSSGYFETMEIPVLRGRLFDESDTADAPPVAVINNAMARQFWPGQDPIGERVSISGSAGPWIQVVGVVRDSTYQSLFAKNVYCLYLPFTQQSVPLATLLVRTELPPDQVTRSLENQIHTISPDLPIFGVGSLWDALNDSLGGFYAYRLGADLTIALGTLGFLLAVIGVYGVIAYNTSRRTKEIGIRMALGGQPRDVLRMIFRQGVKLVSIGTAIGLLFALLISRGLAHAFYGISSAYDPWAYVCVIALVGCVTLLACYIPARRAAQIDPSRALRIE